MSLLNKKAPNFKLMSTSSKIVELNKVKSKLEKELKLAILKKATLFEKDAFMIGYFFGLICKEKNLNNETNIVISMDGRLSSPDLKKQTTF